MTDYIVKKKKKRRRIQAIMSKSHFDTSKVNTALHFKLFRVYSS